MFGFLNINKPVSLSSAHVVSRVRRTLRQFDRKIKVGHAGTLDPLASGVLVIAVGQATRLIEELHRETKAYRGDFLLGQSSESDDLECDPVIHEGLKLPSKQEIVDELPNWIGDMAQVPPKYSAVKVDGKRAYQEARRGADVQLAAKTITIHALTLIEYQYPRLTLEIVCGSGTYIRSLGRDLAEALGTKGLMSALCRTRVGQFELDDALDLEAIDTWDWDRVLVSPLDILKSIKRLKVDELQIQDLFNGRSIQADEDYRNEETIAFVSEFGQLQGLGCFDRESSLYKPTKMFPKAK